VSSVPFASLGALSLGTLSAGHSGGVVLAVAVFLACSVEMVEALTIVIAVGVTRGWRPALQGAAGAVVILVAAVLALGPAVIHLVPINALRTVIGLALLYFGSTWLRKAILRASGRKARHDELATYDETVTTLQEETPVAGHDWVGMAVSFKGVLLEGLEVVIIVLTLGTASHDLGVASTAAGAAVLVVGTIGVLAARPLARVPANAMKMTVGLMLVSFGTFWVGEGLGLSWPGDDAAVLALVAIYGLLSWLAINVLRTRPGGAHPASATGRS
jgi:uncharacterized membrane protein